MKKIFTIILLQLLLISCNNKKNIIENNNKDYINYRDKFDKVFISQFPDKIISLHINLISNTNRKKNDVGFFLYEYEIDKNVINNIKQKFKNKILANYKSSDSCLLVVNRFETFETYKNFDIVKPLDTTLIDKECTKHLYPIPNFISYDENEKREVKLDDSFEIFVLEAESGNHWKKYNMKPSPQMPFKWKNGYSKGIAISEEKKTIIYWSILW